MKRIPRPEFPDPMNKRSAWTNLNGEWDFTIDNGKSGRARNLQEGKDGYDRVINVPFCPESDLSGIGIKDFIPCVWYAKTVKITKKQLSGRVILHIGACDWFTEVFVNGKTAGKHIGGYISFSFDITKLLEAGDNKIVICAEDDVRSFLQATGKQSSRFASYGCFYTRTTGIWQTVWLEYVPSNYILDYYTVTDTNTGIVTITGHTCGSGEIKAETSFEGKPTGTATTVSNGFFSITLKLSKKHLWQVGKGGLYDLVLTFGDDVLCGYFGLRDVALDGFKFLINGKSVFQRLVLDQGFYPDGIYTAPTEKALENDILLSMACGFNGARLHEKIFEPLFLYHADRLGYIVWGEFPNWGLGYHDPRVMENIIPEWTEELKRDRNHPSIVGWCPFNETWDKEGNRQRNALLSCIYTITKSIDPTRPCIDTSGNYHVLTDIFDVHNYEQDPKVFAETYQPLAERGELVDRHSARQTYRGEPVFVSEYGGIGLEEGCNDKYMPRDRNSTWSYGKAAQTVTEYIERYRALTDSLLDNPKLFGFCYTQLYDVEQEKNGVYTYSRKPKFDVKLLAKINRRKAAIEK